MNLMLEDVLAVLLDDAVSAGDLDAAAAAMYDIFCTVVAVDQESADTALASGKALSPRLAATCLKDGMRTAVFLRGIDQAVRERKPLDVLYAGTGPFAPLVLPLMSRFPTVRFTFLDVHQHSIDSVRALTRHFGLTNCDFVVADATEYQHGRPIDLLIVETIQAALAKEPQVAIVRHLVPQLAPGGVLIPERVTVDAVLVDVPVESRRAMGHPVPPGARINLGTVVELTAAATRFELTAAVPDHHHTLAYFTRVEVFGKHVLDEYQSGITYPQMLWNFKPRAGETLEFRYEMGKVPGVALRVVPS